MKWLELRLGRLPQALVWHEIDRAARYSLADRGYTPDGLLEGEAEFDALVGQLFLKAEPPEIQGSKLLPGSPTHSSPWT